MSKPEITVITPQFTRLPSDPKPLDGPPGGFENLVNIPTMQFREIGMRPWGQQEDAAGREFGPMLWLFPGEWYSKIPVGFDIVTIFFRQEKFAPGKTDNDIRFGCLSFGILRP